MTAHTFIRGHACEWDGEKWVYSDTKEPITQERPCKKCGQLPTAEGHDHCLGHIEGAQSACCGHGVMNGFTLYEDGRCEAKKNTPATERREHRYTAELLTGRPTS